MAVAPSPNITRYFDFRLGLGIPLALMVLLLLLDPSGVDFALAQLFYEPGLGFIGKMFNWRFFGHYSMFFVVFVNIHGG